MIGLVSSLSYAGLACLAFSMNRHHGAVFSFEAGPSRRLVFRSLGWLVLGLAGVSALWIHGLGIGLVLWLALLAVTGLLLTLQLTYLPRLTVFLLTSLSLLLL